MDRGGLHILLVDDEAETLLSLADGLNEEGFECSTARSAREALDQIEAGGRFDAVVTDLRLPNMSGLDLTRRLKERWSWIEVIILTAYPTNDSALLGGRLGVASYLSKPVSPSRLVTELHKVLEARNPEAVEAARAAMARRQGVISAGECYHGLVGRHPSMKNLQKDIEKLADLEPPVLVLGESGTGKELVARALHEASSRSSEPFVAVNCGAIPHQLLESELFGHARGAFTGADAERVGFFVSAGQGTLFLDEIAEMSLDLQVKLLRSLQEKEVVPLGHTRPVPWHARLVCATNVDIDAAVNAGRFRRDLYYRINVLRLNVPPLRERRSDIALLAAYFLDRVRKDRTGPCRLSREALDALGSYQWPGNVRELENTIIQVAALCQNEAIRPEDLPVPSLRGAPPVRREHARLPASFPTHDELVRRHVIEALRRTRGVRTQAAQQLGIDRNRLARWIDRYEIDVAQAVAEGDSDWPSTLGS